MSRCDPFPSHEHHEEVRGEHEDEHREEEKVQVREIAPVSAVVPHVSDRIHVDQEPDEGHERDHQGREGVEPEGGVDDPLGGGARDLPHGLVDPERNPTPEGDGVGRSAGQVPDPDVRIAPEREDAGGERGGERPRRNGTSGSGGGGACCGMRMGGPPTNTRPAGRPRLRARASERAPGAGRAVQRKAASGKRGIAQRSPSTRIP